MIEDHKYDELRKKLKSLPRIGAHSDFEYRLSSRLSAHRTGKQVRADRRLPLLNIFRHPAFTPVVAFSSVIVVSLIIYFSFFQSSKRPETTYLTAPEQKNQSSVTQLESLKTKIGKTEGSNLTFAEDRKPVPKPGDESILRTTESAVSFGKVSDRETEYKKPEEQPVEKVSGPEKKDDNEESVRSKSEEKNILDEITKGVLPSKKNEVEPSNKTLPTDSTKGALKKKKSKKVETKSDTPPVEQK